MVRYVNGTQNTVVVSYSDIGITISKFLIVFVDSETDIELST